MTVPEKTFQLENQAVLINEWSRRKLAQLA